MQCGNQVTQSLLSRSYETFQAIYQASMTTGPDLDSMWDQSGPQRNSLNLVAMHKMQSIVVEARSSALHSSMRGSVDWAAAGTDI